MKPISAIAFFVQATFARFLRDFHQREVHWYSARIHSLPTDLQRAIDQTNADYQNRIKELRLMADQRKAEWELERSRHVIGRKKAAQRIFDLQLARIDPATAQMAEG